MGYYLGIDGGGTKTTVAVGDENGLIFKQIGKSINFYSVGMDAARANLQSVIGEVESVIDTDKFESVFIGCSALDGEADNELIERLCSGIINTGKIKMNSDVFIALESLNGAECPCVAVCGTGSMAIGRDADANTFVTGGWGHIIGDEGSAYAIAADALRLCCKQSDKGESTRLVHSANEFFGVTDFRKVIDIIYSPETTKDVIASFSSNVGALANCGDEAAIYILNNQALQFADTVMILLEKIRFCDVLGLFGGLFENSKVFKAAFCSRIAEAYPDLTISQISIPPEESALKLARMI